MAFSGIAQGRNNSSLIAPKIGWIWSLVLLVFLVGCGAGKLMVLEPSGTEHLKISSVNIKEEQPTVKISDEDREKFRQALKEVLESKCGLKVTNDTPDLVVDYRIIQYNPGSRTARWFWGGVGNAGEGSITVDVAFFSSDGKKLGHIQAEGKIQSGFFGGSFSYAIHKAAEQIGDYIKQYLMGIQQKT